MLWNENVNHNQYDFKIKGFDGEDHWVGVISNPDEVNIQIKAYRRFGLISPFVSAHWEIQNNEMYIFTDGGRLCRPLLYYDNIESKFAFERKEILKALQKGEFTWKGLVVGMNEIMVADYTIDSPVIYTPRILYGVEIWSGINLLLSTISGDIM